MIIDSHHHFWVYDPVAYSWIGQSMQILRRNYLPSDLQTELTTAGIDRVLSVQARQSEEETEWLLKLANENAIVAGVVGWAPLQRSDVAQQLERWTHDPRLKSIRHVVQDEADGFLDDPDFNRGVRQLNRYALAYDLLIYARQLPEAIRFVDRHPQQRFILDHIAKPTISGSELDVQWVTNIRQLAKRPHIACKFSGVVTEVRDEHWSLEQLRSYWEIALEAFGPQRMMFGSDWPVCLLRSGYAEWADICRQLASGLSGDERSAFWGGTAADWYRL